MSSVRRGADNGISSARSKISLLLTVMILVLSVSGLLCSVESGAAYGLPDETQDGGPCTEPAPNAWACASAPQSPGTTRAHELCTDEPRDGCRDDADGISLVSDGGTPCRVVLPAGNDFKITPLNSLPGEAATYDSFSFKIEVDGSCGQSVPRISVDGKEIDLEDGGYTIRCTERTLIITVEGTGTGDCTVNIKSSDDSLGTVVPNERIDTVKNIPIEINGDTLTIGDRSFTATPSKGDEQCSSVFKAWNIGAETVTGDITIAADFERILNRYDVVWKNTDGTVLEKQSVPFGETPEYNGEVPTKEPTKTSVFEFSGWDRNPEEVSGNETYTAKYIESARHYTVTLPSGEGFEAGFVGDKGDGFEFKDRCLFKISLADGYRNSDIVVKAGDEVLPLVDGAYMIEEVTGDIDVTVEGIFPDLFVLRFECEDPGFGSVDADMLIDVPFDSVITIYGNRIVVNMTEVVATPVVSEPDASFSFNRWSIDDGTHVKEDMVIKAYFVKEPKVFTVKFNSLGGSPVEPQEHRYNDKVREPEEPTWKGHEFVGWFPDRTSDEPWDFSANTVQSDITLYAKWEAEREPDVKKTVSTDENGSVTTAVTTTQKNRDGNVSIHETKEVRNRDGTSESTVTDTLVKENGTSSGCSHTDRRDASGHLTGYSDTAFTSRTVRGVVETSSVETVSDPMGNLLGTVESLKKENRSGGTTEIEVTETVRDMDGKVTEHVESKSVVSAQADRKGRIVTAKEETVVERTGSTERIVATTVLDGSGNVLEKREIRTSTAETRDGSGNLTGTVEESVNTEYDGDGGRDCRTVIRVMNPDGRVIRTTDVGEHRSSDGDVTTTDRKTERNDEGKIVTESQSIIVRYEGGRKIVTVSTVSNDKSTGASSESESEESSYTADGIQYVKRTVTTTEGTSVSVAVTDGERKVIESSGSVVVKETVTTTTTTDGRPIGRETVTTTSVTEQGRTSVHAVRVAEENGSKTTVTTDTETVLEKESNRTSSKTVTATSEGTTYVDTVRIASKDGDGNCISVKEAATITTETQSGMRIENQGSIVNSDGSVESVLEASGSATTVIRPGSPFVSDSMLKEALEQNSEISKNMKNVDKSIEVRVPGKVNVTISGQGIPGQGIGLTVRGDDSRVSFDEDVCGTISGKGTVMVSMLLDATGRLNIDQKEAVGSNRFVVVDLTAGGNAVHDLGGKATVSFKYVPDRSEDPGTLCVYRVDKDGSLVPVEFAYGSETITLSTGHLSVFMVGSVEEPSEQTPPIGLLLIASGIGILAVALLVRRFRNAGMH